MTPSCPVSDWTGVIQTQTLSESTGGSRSNTDGRPPQQGRERPASVVHSSTKGTARQDTEGYEGQSVAQRHQRDGTDIICDLVQSAEGYCTIVLFT